MRVWSLNCLIGFASGHLKWVIGFGALGSLTPDEFARGAITAAAAVPADDGLSYRWTDHTARRHMLDPCLLSSLAGDGWPSPVS
jgi:hypothetical protein